MSEPFLGEIKLVSFNFAPKGWAMCNGQFLPINQNQALFSLMGTNYGGNGQTTFALPNLRGRIPISMGSSHTLGEAAGTESVTLSISQMPAHVHNLGIDTQSATTDNVAGPSGHAFGFGVANQTPGGPTTIGYFGTTPATTLATQSVSNTGGSQPHENRQPYLVLNFVVALQGIFPSRN